MPTALERLLTEIRACTLCAEHLTDGVRPVLQAHRRARVLIAGQAPGRKVHLSGVPFDDPSGDRLRDWLGVDRETFYDAGRFAIAPMGFCFPGSGRSGDLAPRSECAPAWRERLLAQLEDVRLTLVIGKYAMDWHLPNLAGKSVTERVASWRDHAPACIPLPHPSPRNNRWLKANPWFEDELLPELRTAVARALSA